MQQQPIDLSALPCEPNNKFVFLYKDDSMVRAYIKPQNQDISIHIPENYIGRELEVLLYPVDELTEAELPVKKSIASLRGSLKLTDTEYKDLQQYLNDVRNEWEQNT